MLVFEPYRRAVNLIGLGKSQRPSPLGPMTIFSRLWALSHVPKTMYALTQLATVNSSACASVQSGGRNAKPAVLTFENPSSVTLDEAKDRFETILYARECRVLDEVRRKRVHKHARKCSENSTHIDIVKSTERWVKTQFRIRTIVESNDNISLSTAMSFPGTHFL